MSLTHVPEWAMVNINGDLFYPDNPEDAVHFQANHGAWPVLPLRFPWPAQMAEAAMAEFRPR